MRSARTGAVALAAWSLLLLAACGPSADAAAEAAGVAVVPVTETLPDGADYVSWMQGNIDDVAAALSA